MPLADKHSRLLERLRSHITKAEEALLKDSRWHELYGKNMCYLRKKMGVSNNVTSERSGLNPTLISRLENGQVRWTVDLAEKYLSALKD